MPSYYQKNNNHFKLLTSLIVGYGLILCVFLSIMNNPMLASFENFFLDSFFKTRKPLTTHSDIVIVKIDERSLSQVDRFPWPRHYHAALVHILRNWNTKSIVFDAVFASRSNSYDDATFLDALSQEKDVYLPIYQEMSQNLTSWTHNYPEFEAQAKGIGHVNVFTDDHGIIRKFPLILETVEEMHPHLALQVASDVLGKDYEHTYRFYAHFSRWHHDD